MSTSWRHYYLELLGLPWAQQAAEQSLGCFDRDANGTLTFDRSRLSKLAPHLAALVSWLSETDGAPDALAPDVAERLLMSAHLVNSQAAAPPAWVLRAADIGLRAEQYSLYLERSRKPPTQVLHVAAESDRYGYDIEDRTVDPPAMIEVKGSTSSAVSFFVTRKEWEIAALHPDQYVVQYWGRIDLRRPMRQEYVVLRTAGYPLQIPRFTESIEAGKLQAQPSQWLVTQSQELDGDSLPSA